MAQRHKGQQAPGVTSVPALEAEREGKAGEGPEAPWDPAGWAGVQQTPGCTEGLLNIPEERGTGRAGKVKPELPSLTGSPRAL